MMHKKLIDDAPAAASVLKRSLLTASIVALFGVAAAPAHALTAEDLLDKLNEKGVVSEQEYQEMRATAREERQKRKMKEAKDEAAAPTKLTGIFRDGFRLESGDKQHSIGIIGRVHADYRGFSPDDRSADTFDIRRARLGMSGKVYEDVTFEVVGEFAAAANAAATTGLDVAWVNYGWIKPAQIRVGQFKMPFNLETMVSSNNIDFQERAMNSSFAPGKERGLMVHGAPFDGVTYALALSNGAGQNNNDTSAIVDGKDTIGRLTFNIPAMLGNKDYVVHLGTAYTTGTQPAGPLTSGFRTEGRGATFFTPNVSGGTEFDRERSGAELALAYGPVKLQGEWMNVSFDGTGFSREVKSSYVSAMWAITGESYVNAYRDGIFRNIKPNSEFMKGAKGMGAWVVGARFSKFDAGDFATGTFTGIREADAVTVGLNWIPNAMTRVMLNYTQTDFATSLGNDVNGLPINDEKAITLRTQFNW